MIIIECDRCGDKVKSGTCGFTPNDRIIRPVTLRIGDAPPSNSVDLCPNCIGAAREFICTPIPRQA